MAAWTSAEKYKGINLLKILATLVGIGVGLFSIFFGTIKLLDYFYVSQSEMVEIQKANDDLIKGFSGQIEALDVGVINLTKLFLSIEITNKKNEISTVDAIENPSDVEKAFLVRLKADLSKLETQLGNLQ